MERTFVLVDVEAASRQERAPARAEAMANSETRAVPLPVRAGQPPLGRVPRTARALARILPDGCKTCCGDSTCERPVLSDARSKFSMARNGKAFVRLWQPTSRDEETLDARVAVVVPVRDRLAATVRFLESFQQVSYPAYTLVVVDDGSTDGTRDVLRERFPEVVCLEGDGNLWWTPLHQPGGALRSAARLFARADDQQRHARPSRLPDPPGADVAGAPGLHHRQPHQLPQPPPHDLVGGRLHELAGGTHPPMRDHGGQEEQVLAGRANPCPVEILTGCGTLVPAECYRRIGLYDAHACPQYHADSEFILRACKRGHPALVDLDAVIWNDVTSTCMSRNLFRRRSPLVLACHPGDSPPLLSAPAPLPLPARLLWLAAVPRRRSAAMGALWSQVSRVWRPGLFRFRRAAPGSGARTSPAEQPGTTPTRTAA